MKGFDEMLDEFMDQYPQAADEIEALRAKVGGAESGMAEEMPEDEGELEIEIKPGMHKPIPKDLMDDEEAVEDDEESMY
jgi:hypothetical protein